MNQRIVLPAIVIGGLFAALLTFVRGLLPEADPALLFALDAAFLVAAVALYGALMREAAAAAIRAAEEKAQPGRRRGGDRKRDETRGGRSRGGRGGRGGDRDGGEKPRGEKNGRSKSGGEKPRERAAAAGPREDGQVKWFSGAKGYGFIIRPDGEEIFVHHRSLRDKSRREIPDGQEVSYVVVDREKGPQADDVELKGTNPAENAA